MAYMIEITKDKMSDLAENTEKALRYMGKVMQCIDELKNEGGSGMQERMGNRGGYYGNRDMEYHGGYGNRDGGYGMRGDWGDMGERRMRDSMGRFM
jgi:hypothetical protein